MQHIESINSERIRWCCHDRGVTTRDLANELQFSWERFQRVLSEGSGLTFNQLRKVAEYFNRGVLFFLEDAPVNAEQVYTPQFRTIANQKPAVSPKVRALIERVERHRDIYVSLQEGLEDDERVIFDPPEFPARSVKRAAEIVREWLNLEDLCTFSTYRHAVESRGLLVFRSNGYAGPWQIPKDDPICGFTVYDANCPVIVVKKMPFESRQTFTLMHELGHVLLHRQSFIDDEGDLHAHAGKERKMNAFAGYLLVPDKFLQLVDDSDRPSRVSEYDDWLRQFRKRWGVSSEVILRRLMDSGRLDDVSYNRYREWRQKQPMRRPQGGSRLYRHREPKHVFGDPFVTTVLDAFHAKRISLAKASTYLDNLKVSDVHKLEESYAGV